MYHSVLFIPEVRFTFSCPFTLVITLTGAWKDLKCILIPSVAEPSANWCVSQTSIREAGPVGTSMIVCNFRNLLQAVGFCEWEYGWRAWGPQGWEFRLKVTEQVGLPGMDWQREEWAGGTPQESWSCVYMCSFFPLFLGRFHLSRPFQASASKVFRLTNQAPPHYLGYSLTLNVNWLGAFVQMENTFTATPSVWVTGDCGLVKWSHQKKKTSLGYLPIIYLTSSPQMGVQIKFAVVYRLFFL